MTPRSHFLVLAAATALLVAGCDKPAPSENTDATQTTPSVTTVAPSDMTNQQKPTPRLVIDVTIKDGQVTPTNQTLQGKVKDPIVIRVNSDIEDELHIHSVPDHTFKVEPRAGQQFQFTVDVPGTVDVELHHLNRTIASIQVQQ